MLSKLMGNEKLKKIWNCIITKAVAVQIDRRRITQLKPKYNQEHILNKPKRWYEKSAYIKFTFRVSCFVILNNLCFSEDKELISTKLLMSIDTLVEKKESLDIRNVSELDSYYFCISFYNGYYHCCHWKLSS